MFKKLSNLLRDKAGDYTGEEDVDDLLFKAYCEAIKKENWRRALLLSLTCDIKPSLPIVWDDETMEQLPDEFFEVEYKSWEAEARALLNEP